MDTEQLCNLAVQAKVLAWGADRGTGVARHISEVATGLACNCLCAACGHPLEAVNARKTWLRPGAKRPHFRHHSGQEKHNCRVLASRVALRRALLRQDTFELPARSMDADYLGITGARYSGHVSTLATRTRVKAVTFRDDVLAVVSLDDGREIEVYARGTIVSNATEGLCAVVTIDLDDDEAVSLTEAEIRERLFLRPEGIKWVCHWDDAQLLQQAELAAQAHASERLDGDSLVDVPPEWRRESALHLAVKQIIEAELCMTLPSLSASATDATGDLLGSPQLGGASQACAFYFSTSRTAARTHYS